MEHPNRQDRQAEVTVLEWEQRKDFVGFTDDDALLLRDLSPLSKAYADEVVEDLYRQFLRFDETRAFFPDDATLKHVKAMQKQYFLGLTTGEYGQEYLANRLHVGRVHQRIGLSPRWYIGAYSIYMQSVIPRVVDAFGSDPKKAQHTIIALLKIIKLDQELAITTYIAASEAVIARQSQEILEISTPVVQIWEGVIVAPLIGMLDTRRAQQFTERLLTRVVETRSSVALVDITGVPMVDTHTAQYLLEAIAAVRLLGAQLVLTGVRPAIAQTLVHLDIDLEGIVTRTSLEAGLRYAMESMHLQDATSNGHR
jgi:rsbT co-antagonist protein RsbR